MTLVTKAKMRPAAGLALILAAVLTAGVSATSTACDKEKRQTAASVTVAASRTAPVVTALAPSAASLKASSASICSPAACKSTQMRGAKAAVARRTATPPKRSKRVAPASRVVTAPSSNVALAPPAADAPGTAGLVVAIDPATGRIVPPTPEQMEALTAAAAERGAAELSSKPEVYRLPGGGTLARLNGQFMQYSMVRMDGHGKRFVECAGDPNAPQPAAPVQAPTPQYEVK